MRSDAAGLAAQHRHRPPAHQVVAGGHLGDHQTCAELRGQPAERRVGDAGHRRQQGTVGELKLAYFQRLGGSICRCGHGLPICSARRMMMAAEYCEHISWAVKHHAYTLDKTAWHASAVQQNMLVSQSW